MLEKEGTLGRRDEKGLALSPNPNGEVELGVELELRNSHVHRLPWQSRNLNSP